MNTETCKYLTEEVLKQCWHESKMEMGCMICTKCGIQEPHIPINPTFTTANEIKLLTDKMKEDEQGQIQNKWWHFNSWLKKEHLIHGYYYTYQWEKLEPQEQAQLIADFYRSLK